MRNQFDFTPLFRTAVGFDRMARALDQASRYQTETGYPPYNIERLDTDRYRVTLALAGFSKDDIEVVAEGDTLTVKGRSPKAGEAETVTYLHRGIAGRAFERRFQLAEYVEVTDASLENGVLVIALERKVPEAQKPRTIDVKTDGVKQLAKEAA